MSHPRSRSLHREASAIQPSAFLKFDVAKLGWKRRENKEMASTICFHKSLINKLLQNSHLYKGKRNTRGTWQQSLQARGANG
ncbi:hypothetical protein E5355_07700 [Bacteroides muris (ex Afrizal et al. 2022)]|uniref:Uncharacterized protein n=1 Tax=Bacteroides muris (ex Afrizal et al. 2022) TaxID=2516960 RepID=A0A4S2AYY9_9BACE|nr:hypothetical protein E5355_07700 [Bacteroides muris (ex Afrizal et al. 2022)]